MLEFPNIDPVLLSLGPVKIHWYGFMYLMGFAAFWWLGNRRVAQYPESGWTKDDVSDLLFYGALGVILGGRIGYMLVYGHASLAANPLNILKVWEGGMSFHGGAVAVVLFWWWWGKRHNRKFLEITDFLVPAVPIGIGLVRVANFINGELWGRVTDSPLGMVFPTGGLSPRHPSQLYEAFFEGFLLFVVLWIFARKPRATGAVSGLFLVGYGLARFNIEFFRQPDAHMGEGGFLWEWLTTGQLLSLPMIVAGLLLLALAYKNKTTV